MAIRRFPSSAGVSGDLGPDQCEPVAVVPEDSDDIVMTKRHNDACLHPFEDVPATAFNPDHPRLIAGRVSKREHAVHRDCDPHIERH